MPEVQVEHYVTELRDQRDKALEEAAIRGAQLRQKEQEVEDLRTQLARVEAQLAEATDGGSVEGGSDVTA